MEGKSVSGHPEVHYLGELKFLEGNGIMLTLKNLVFNPFEVNTYFVIDDDGACLIIDPSCSNEDENKRLIDFISTEGLRPEMVLLTHAHFDHLTGVSFVIDKYNIPLCGHREDLNLLQFARHQGDLYGFLFEEDPPEFDKFLEDEELLEWSGGSMKALHVPGHTRGSLSYFFPEAGFVITGDALFREGVGRSDLPGGDHDTLIRSIENKLLVLDDSVEVFPGHGPSSTVGHEKMHNPFLS